MTKRNRVGGTPRQTSWRPPAIQTDCTRQKQPAWPAVHAAQRHRTVSGPRPRRHGFRRPSGPAPPRGDGPCQSHRMATSWSRSRSIGPAAQPVGPCTRPAAHPSPPAKRHAEISYRTIPDRGIAQHGRLPACAAATTPAPPPLVPPESPPSRPPAACGPGGPELARTDLAGLLCHVFSCLCLPRVVRSRLAGISQQTRHCAIRTSAHAHNNARARKNAQSHARVRTATSTSLDPHRPAPRACTWKGHLLAPLIPLTHPPSFFIHPASLTAATQRVHLTP